MKNVKSLNLKARHLVNMIGMNGCCIESNI